MIYDSILDAIGKTPVLRIHRLAGHRANLPAEELLRIDKGAYYGWPECYFDDTEGILVLAPEYGGDGGKLVGQCAAKRTPIATFPATGRRTTWCSTTEICS